MWLARQVWGLAGEAGGRTDKHPAGVPSLVVPVDHPVDQLHAAADGNNESWEGFSDGCPVERGGYPHAGEGRRFDEP